MSLTEFLNSRGVKCSEGYSQQVTRQVDDLIKLTKSSNINVMEIGFHAGHSAEVFLQNNPTLTLTSFDLGVYNYVHMAKEYIDSAYPNRHTLILGNSTVTVPNYINQNPNKVFDIIFIDGGHEYNVAKGDLDNCRKLADKDTIVIMDDTIYTKGWEQSYTIGPTKTWTEHLNSGLITGINKMDYQLGRGMSWGAYVF